MKVLVADDDPVFLESIERMLKHHNVLTKPLMSGSQVIYELWEKPDDYECLIISESMDGLDGVETSRMIKKIRNEKTRLPIVMILPEGDVKAEARARFIGVNHFIYRPVTDSELFSIVRKVSKNRLKAI